MPDAVITGSTALHHHLGLPLHDHQDLDLAYTGTLPGIMPEQRRLDAHELPAHIMHAMPCDGVHVLGDATWPVISAAGLLALKISHAAWDIHWNKTMSHVLTMQRRWPHCMQAVEQLDSWIVDLQAHWAVVHAHLKPRISLQRPDQEFFADAVARQYTHDDLHVIMALHGKPLYQSCLADQATVQLDKSRFLAMPWHLQLDLAREEIHVIALERFLIPQQFKICHHAAYRSAARLVCIRLTQGWFPRFIAENWLHLYKPAHNYVKTFHARVHEINKKNHA